jgi:DNA (cytosine-5)-methyltransferase 1
VGYHRAGFDVVGVDIKPQPRYPFEFHQADALSFPLDGFDAIHASPPCQKFSVTARIHGRTETYPDLVQPTRILLMLANKPYVMENVVGAPVAHPILLCGLMFGLGVLRHRLFETMPWMLSPPHPRHPGGNLTNACDSYSTGETGFVCVAGNNFNRVAGTKAMGIDWKMTRKELAQAIPPAYTEYIGKQLLAAIGGGT